MSRTRLFAQLKSSMERVHSRREFLRNSAVVVAGAALSSTRLSVFAAPAREPILILGGGAAGLAAGYTLLKAGVPFYILEASDRVGGRIFTQFDFNTHGQFVELGGEFIDKEHKEMFGLAREMGLQVDSLRANDKGLEPFLYAHSGMVYRERDLEDHVAPLVKAVVAAQKNGARAFTYREAGKVSEQTLKYDQMSIEEFLAGIPGLEAWVRELVSVAYTTENGLDASQQSALNLITMIGTESGSKFRLYGESDEGHRIRGGNLKLMQALADKIKKKNPDSLMTESTLRSLTRKAGKITATFERQGKMQQLTASRAICTLPFSVLRGMSDLNAWGLSAKKMECIREIGYGTNSKIVMEFSSRLWRTQKDAVAFTGSGYGNFFSQSFWEASRAQSGPSGLITAYLGGKHGMDAKFQTITENCLPDFGKFCPGAKAQYLKGMAYNWNYMPTAKGSYSCFTTGQYAKINGAQWEPEWDGALQFAGEHTSKKYQSYMNGAIETGITAAKAFLRAVHPLASESR